MEEEVRQRVVEIRDRVESAYQVLARREHRHAYRMRIMPEYKLAHAIPLFLKQSELAEKREQWGDAADSLRRVLEIDPDHRDAKRRLDMVLKRSGDGLGEESSSAPL
jgi:lipopolysaccharide biosynthesis regulator YciM